jgi:hypothetical protein
MAPNAATRTFVNGMNRRSVVTTAGGLFLTALAGAAAAAANLGILRSAPLPHVGELAPIAGVQSLGSTSTTVAPSTAAPGTIGIGPESDGAQRTTSSTSTAHSQTTLPHPTSTSLPPPRRPDDDDRRHPDD